MIVHDSNSKPRWLNPNRIDELQELSNDRTNILMANGKEYVMAEKFEIVVRKINRELAPE